MPQIQIALNRFGLGIRAGETPPADPRRWLLDQLERYDPAPAAVASLPGSRQLVTQLAAVRLDRQEREKAMAEQSGQQMAAQADNPEREILRPLRQSYVEAAAARNMAAFASATPFMERLVAFWSNHFAVSIDKPATLGLAGAFENEAIRPHVMGKFSSMLLAVERHPAMLLYLDQAQSIGPNSKLAEAAQRRGAQRQPGLNENLAREILELHTLGVRSGYSQADVTEFAKALTGWTVTGLGRIARLLPYTSGEYAFVPQLHEPGPRTVAGKRYADDGEKMGQAILMDLAAHPATARHIATKLARHFAADDPPAPLVARLEQAFLKTGGDLPALYRILIDAPEIWEAKGSKFRQPWEWLTAVQRASGVPFPAQATVFTLNQLGQSPWKPGSPAGWDDIAASWAAPDALLRRVEVANRYARSLTALDARALAPKLFPDSLSEATRQAIARADSGQQALALLFVSPEMLRR
ncbi:DUF1800 family protein [Novosphingobium sp. TH158]|uniref:DUF1800 domain-containing protein n=1 Tax=Novosphingobium sp. TH158 TaxID=2067455 RepID=UPI000C79DB5C|nr:DUF1800 domain-containing protein [Novosphingobium sp. TH158]PLK25631.1 DUF1800 domain-containing protein [Novosphingobium sp. TH158]